MRSRILALLSGVAIGLALPAQTTPPPNRVAWLAIFPEPLPDGRSRASLEYTSQFLRRDSEQSSDGRTFARLDGEEWQITADMATDLGAGRLNLRLRLVDRSGGFTDSFIQNLHSAMGLPNGGRDEVPNNRLAYHLERDGTVIADLKTSGLRLMDTDVAYVQPFGSEASGGRFGASVQLPTGHRDDFSGSGSWDGVVGAAGWHRWGKWVVHGQAEEVFIRVGDGNPYRAVLSKSSFSRFWAGLGRLGESPGFWGGLGVDVTFACTQTPYRTGIGHVDNVGLQQHWVFTHQALPGWRFGFSEEAGSYTAPDITLFVSRDF